MDVEGFSSLAAKFKEITDRIVWCTLTPVDRRGRIECQTEWQKANLPRYGVSQ